MGSDLHMEYGQRVPGDAFMGDRDAQQSKLSPRLLEVAQELGILRSGSENLEQQIVEQLARLKEAQRKAEQQAQATLLSDFLEYLSNQNIVLAEDDGYMGKHFPSPDKTDEQLIQEYLASRSQVSDEQQQGA